MKKFVAFSLMLVLLGSCVSVNDPLYKKGPSQTRNEELYAYDYDVQLFQETTELSCSRGWELDKKHTAHDLQFYVRQTVNERFYQIVSVWIVTPWEQNYNAYSQLLPGYYPMVLQGIKKNDYRSYTILQEKDSGRSNLQLIYMNVDDESKSEQVINPVMGEFYIK